MDINQKFDLIIFDADGTLRRCTVPGQKTPNGPGQWELMEGVVEKLSEFNWGDPRRGRTALGIASNQAGIYYGYLNEEEARRLLKEMVKAAVGFKPVPGSIRICPHGIEENCSCRKPGPQMLQELMVFFGVLSDRALFVGDM